MKMQTSSMIFNVSTLYFVALKSFKEKLPLAIIARHLLYEQVTMAVFGNFHVKSPGLEISTENEPN